MNPSEHRVLARFPIEMPVTLQVAGTGAVVQATTKDVSASGVFFYTYFEIRQGSNIEFIMTLPAELTHTTGIQVACKGTVLRVHAEQDGRIGVAASIQCFEFVMAAMSAAPVGYSPID
ncbi:MAG TPA: PilZ domain-containing protein [Terriglobales bacterium]|nr:PilZ domain-containing protein [Terriglobales bacterium]